MKKRILLYLTACFVSSLFIAACGGDANHDSTSEQAPADTAAVAEQPALPVTLTDFSTSPDFPDAKISMDYKGGKFTFKVDSKTYQLEEQTTDAPQKMCANSKDGQHIHLIVDNGPYDALYKPEFEKEVEDGDHYILAFLSRSYHESIKTATAHTLLKASVKDKSVTNAAPVKDPMVFYSRPKAKYTGKSETDKVMLDFYLANVTLSPDGYKVKVQVNGETEFTIDNWRPYFLEGLPMGDNKIKLTLVDKDGNPVNSPLNPVERVFTLIDDPAPGQ